MNCRVALGTLSVIVIMLLSFSVMTPSKVRAEWVPSADLSVSPGIVYIDVQMTFTYELYNGKSSSVDLVDIHVQFDWQTTYYDLLDTSVSIAPYTSYSFDATITIPDVTTGVHTQEIYIKGQAVGDWFESSGTWTDTFEVRVVPPLAVSISPNPSSGTAPLTVDFTSYVTGGYGAYSYSWSFGDGQSSIASNPSHIYASAGSYTVTLIVTDFIGNVESDTTTVSVSEAESFAGDIASGDSGALIIILILVSIVAAIIVVIALLVTRKK